MVVAINRMQVLSKGGPFKPRPFFAVTLNHEAFLLVHNFWNAIACLRDTWLNNSVTCQVWVCNKVLAKHKAF